MAKYLPVALTFTFALAVFGCTTASECRARHPGDLRLEPFYRGELRYPDDVSGTHGTVSLHVEVKRNGFVSRVVTIESDPVGVFDEVAIEYVSRWRYCPRARQEADFPSPMRVELELRPPS